MAVDSSNNPINSSTFIKVEPTRSKRPVNGEFALRNSPDPFGSAPCSSSLSLLSDSDFDLSYQIDLPSLGSWK